MALVMSERRYQRGDASAAQLQEVVDEVLAHLADPDSEVASAARAAGLEPAELSDVNAEVREGAQGAEPVLTTIVVGIAVAAGSRVADTLWEEVIWPRVRRRLGVKALGARSAALEDGRS
ncbi:MAG TPA: hypothetical protein VFQ77_08815 [Pseudonocardiaceae bacterium]|jgi:hypothetical protein|nr:hypothetical protein [Pseudonocardiaceae bacterium]